MNIPISVLPDYEKWTDANIRERSPADREDELGIGCDDDEEDDGVEE